MTTQLENFTGNGIYLDTMLPYALLRGIEPRVQTFFRRLELGEVEAFTSVLTFDELAYRLLLALIKDQYAGSPLEQLRNNEIALLTQFAPKVSSQLNQLRMFPHLTILSIMEDDIAAMSGAMQTYQLRPRDALHWAAMQRVGCFYLASNDHHFDRISDIQRFAF